MSTTDTASPKKRLSFIKRHPRRTILLVLFVLLAGTGGWVYFVRARQAAAESAAAAPQIATVRQGNLIISAGGTGTLAVANEIDLGFTTTGQVTGIFVKPGDQVEAGTLLAQVDDQDAQANYTQAKRAYEELTSAAAIATVQQQVAQAQADLMSAKYDLEYLISPDVMYWETEIAKGQQALTEAEAIAEANPSDEEAQQALSKAKDYLGFAQDKLKEAWKLYYDEYVPKTFRLAEYPNGTDYYIIPNDLEIKLARTAIDEAQNKLNDSQDYYNLLLGGPTPEDMSSAAIVKLQQAERDMQDAQAALDGTKIVAPIAGTILSVNAITGNPIRTQDTDTETATGTVIAMADLSKLEVDFYIDESDWDLAAVGNQAEVTFDALPGQSFTGQVTQLDTELYQSNNSSVVKGIVQLDSSLDGVDLPIGASASVEIIHARAENVTLVPIEALHETSPGKYTVFVIENGTPTAREVEIGLQDEVYAEVKSGLKAGDVVATSPVTTD
ncbi:MAG: efflux RND transporter periplasmic adaptor subunit [Anaerolineales bacterium]